MKLITDLGTFRDAGGIARRRGVFFCAYCQSSVDKKYQDGLRDKSCGCVRGHLISASQTVHGLSRRGANRHPLFVVWRGIKSRCLNPRNIGYARYGGRGITICAEWINDPNAFVLWSIANGWKPGFQIDRIDNDGDYGPNNCRFISQTQNMRNSSATKLSAPVVLEMRRQYAVGGITFADLGRQYGVTDVAARNVIHHKTWKNIGG